MYLVKYIVDWTRVAPSTHVSFHQTIGISKNKKTCLIWIFVLLKKQGVSSGDGCLRPTFLGYNAMAFASLASMSCLEVLLRHCMAWVAQKYSSTSQDPHLLMRLCPFEAEKVRVQTQLMPPTPKKKANVRVFWGNQIGWVKKSIWDWFLTILKAQCLVLLIDITCELIFTLSVVNEIYSSSHPKVGQCWLLWKGW